jgi:prepilin-type N-terminal cleavage/methylation domain-containing protein
MKTCFPNKILVTTKSTKITKLRGLRGCSDRQANATRYLRGFTLVELLVVLIIIAILGTVIMFAMFSAQEAARAAKTKNVISKLNMLVMQRYESYINRRVPIPSGRNRIEQSTFQFRRLQALRELMRMEMPDRWTDVKDNPITGIQRPAVNRTYLRRISAANNGSGVNDGDAFQGAECLYLIIAHGTDDADALTHFSQSDVGDADADGLPEFLDGWGRPISFVRWPAGFVSPRQSRDAAKEFDQFNPYRVIPDRPNPPTNVPRQFALFPLIYSGGPDKKYDIGIGSESAGGNAVAIHYSTAGNPPYVDPYLPLPSGNAQVGQPNDNDGDGSLDHVDNIHNHELSIR